MANEALKVSLPPIANAFCTKKGCGFTPQEIFSLTNAPGGDLEWLEGRVRHHDATHDHQATLLKWSSPVSK